MRIGRRSFLVMAISATIVAMKPALAALAGERRIADGRLSHELLGLFRDRNSARAVGRAYLAEVPMEADRDLLLALIRRGSSDADAPGAGASIREWARARIRDDFAAGRVATVQGWILSETEVRVCALCALS